MKKPLSLGSAYTPPHTPRSIAHRVERTPWFIENPVYRTGEMAFDPLLMDSECTLRGWDNDWFEVYSHWRSDRPQRLCINSSILRLPFSTTFLRTLITRAPLYPSLEQTLLRRGREGDALSFLSALCCFLAQLEQEIS